MRALRDLGPERGVALDRAAPDPAPAPGEAIVRPSRVRIAWEDAAALGSGEARTIGSQFVGVVDRIEPEDGPGAERAARLVGARVVGSPQIVCGVCDTCRAGLPAHCRDSETLGAGSRDGCLADAFAVPARNLVAVPDDLDDDRAVFTMELASALHAARQVHLEGRPYITVLGANSLGLLCAQVMNRLNASVRLVGDDEERLAVCDKWRIKSRRSAEVGRRADQDVVVECTGTPEGADLAMGLVRARGVVVLKRGGLDASVGVADLVRREARAVGSGSGSPAEALAALRSGAVDVAPLMSRRFSLDDGPDAVALAASGGALSVVVEP